MHYDNRGRKLFLAAQRSGSGLRASELAVYTTLVAQHGSNTARVAGVRIPPADLTPAVAESIVFTAKLSARWATHAAAHLLASLPSDGARARFVAEVAR